MKTPEVIEKNLSEDNETGVDLKHHRKNSINDIVLYIIVPIDSKYGSDKYRRLGRQTFRKLEFWNYERTWIPKKSAKFAAVSDPGSNSASPNMGHFLIKNEIFEKKKPSLFQKSRCYRFI